MYLIYEAFESRGYHPHFVLEFIYEIKDSEDAYNRIANDIQDWKDCQFYSGVTNYSPAIWKGKFVKNLKTIYVFEKNIPFYRFSIRKHLSKEQKAWIDHAIPSSNTGYTENWDKYVNSDKIYKPEFLREKSNV